MIKPLTIAEIELVAFNLAKKLMTWDEPIPEFGSRYPNVLESCLVTPFATYERKNLYKGFEAKAAILFYLMVKNHPFKNGNKRIAIMTLFLFLSKNKRWLKVEPQILYRTAVWVAESPADFNEQVIEAFEKFIKKYVVKKA